MKIVYRKVKLNILHEMRYFLKQKSTSRLLSTYMYVLKHVHWKYWEKSQCLRHRVHSNELETESCIGSEQCNSSGFNWYRINHWYSPNSLKLSTDTKKQYPRTSFNHCFASLYFSFYWITSPNNLILVYSQIYR